MWSFQLGEENQCNYLTNMCNIRVGGFLFVVCQPSGFYGYLFYLVGLILIVFDGADS